MIGFFTIIDKRDSSTYCIVSSDINSALTAKAFIPPLYRDGVSNITNGDKVFCVIDDASGFGAILFKQDDGVTSDNSLILKHDLDVSGDIAVTGKIDASGDIKTSSMLGGKTNLYLTAAHTASIIASGLSGAPVTLPMTVLSDV